MKKALLLIASILCYILFIPCILGVTLAITWYLLPAIQTTPVGIYLVEFIGEDVMPIAAIVATACMVVFGILGKVCSYSIIKSSKILNFYTHFLTWLIALALIAESGYTFVVASVIETTAIKLNLVRKIGLLACGIAMLLYTILAPKVRRLVDRKIQAYDTAKELNAKGRSSVVGMQILKCFDFICPEIFLLVALCFAFNWDIAFYFIFIICAFILPILGNMICDYRVKKEASRKEIESQEAQVHATAEAVVSILEEKGNS